MSDLFKTLGFWIACCLFFACSRSTEPPPFFGPAPESGAVSQCAALKLPNKSLTDESLHSFMTCINRTGAFTGIANYTDRIAPSTAATLINVINRHIWNHPDRKKAVFDWVLANSRAGSWDKQLLPLIRAIDHHQLAQTTIELISEWSERNPDFYNTIVEIIKTIISNRMLSVETLALVNKPSLIAGLTQIWRPYRYVSASETQIISTLQSTLASLAADEARRLRLAETLTTPATFDFLSELDSITSSGVEQVILSWSTHFFDHRTELEAYFDGVAELNRPISCMAGAAHITNGSLVFFDFLADEVGPGFDHFLRSRSFSKISRTASLCNLPLGFERTARILQRAADRGFAPPLGALIKSAASHDRKNFLIGLFTSPASRLNAPVIAGASEKRLLSAIITLSADPVQSRRLLSPMIAYFLKGHGAALLSDVGALKTLISLVRQFRPFMAESEHPISESLRWIAHELETPKPLLLDTVKSVLSDSEFAHLLHGLVFSLRGSTGITLIHNLSEMIRKNEFNRVLSSIAIVLGGMQSEVAPLPAKKPFFEEPVFQAPPFLPLSEAQLRCRDLGMSTPSISPNGMGAFVEMLKCESALVQTQSPVANVFSRLHSNGLLAPLLNPFFELLTSSNPTENGFSEIKLLFKSGLLDSLWRWLSAAIRTGLFSEAAKLLSAYDRGPEAFVTLIRTLASGLENHPQSEALMRVLHLLRTVTPAPIPILSEPSFPSDWKNPIITHTPASLAIFLQNAARRIQAQPFLIQAIVEWVEKNHLSNDQNTAVLLNLMNIFAHYERTIDHQTPIGTTRIRLTGWDVLELLVHEGNFAIGWDELPVEANATIMTLLEIAKSPANPHVLASTLTKLKDQLDMVTGMNADETRRLANIRQAFDFLILRAQDGTLVWVQDLLKHLMLAAPAEIRESRDPAISPFGILIDFANAGALSWLGHLLWKDRALSPSIAQRLLAATCRSIVRDHLAVIEHSQLAILALARSIDLDLDLMHAGTMIVSHYGLETAEISAQFMEFLDRSETPLSRFISMATRLESTPHIRTGLSSMLDQQLRNNNLVKFSSTLASLAPADAKRLVVFLSDEALQSTITTIEDLLEYEPASLDRTRSLLFGLGPSNLTTLADLLLIAHSLPLQGKVRRNLAHNFTDPERIAGFLSGIRSWSLDPEFSASLLAIADVIDCGDFRTLFAEMANTLE